MTSTPRPRAARRGSFALQLSGEQAREFARIKSSRAARVSRARAAGQRRMVISGLSGAALITVAVLAVMGMVGAAWLLVPAATLAAALGASRLAGARNEATREEENERLAELRAGLDPARSVRTMPRADAAAVDEAWNQASARQAAAESARRDAVSRDRASRDAASRGTARESVAAEVAAVADADVVVDAAEVAVAAESAVSVRASDESGPAAEATPPSLAASSSKSQLDAEIFAVAGARQPAVATQKREWTVTPLPAPAYARKSVVKGRRVHPDTDLVPVLRVVEGPARPVAATSLGEPAQAEQATGSMTFDLDQVLRSRRAQ